MKRWQAVTRLEPGGGSKREEPELHKATRRAVKKPWVALEPGVQTGNQGGKVMGNTTHSSSDAAAAL